MYKQYKDIKYRRAIEELKKEGREISSVNIADKMKELGCENCPMPLDSRTEVIFRRCGNRRQMVIRGKRS